MRINWGAIGVCSVVYWLVQAAWFTVFSVPWQSGLRLSPEEIAAYKAHPNFWPYLIALICNFILAFVIARVLALGGTFNVIRGFRIGLLIGLVAAFAMITEMVFEMRPQHFMLISAGCPLAGCALMGVILGIWKPKLADTAQSATEGGL